VTASKLMRVAGRPLDGFNVLPRNLLRHTAQAMAVSPPSIASLRSIYKRRQTLSKHQLWAKTHLGLRDLETDEEASLTATLLAQAADASHSDDLVHSASHWLFTRRIFPWPPSSVAGTNCCGWQPQLHRAAEHLGRLLRTVFLCDYIAIEDFRREIHTLLNRGGSVHQLQRAVYSGKVAPERCRRREEMPAISGSHALLTNIVLAWNTSRMHEVVERLKRDGTRIEDDWLRRIGPTFPSVYGRRRAKLTALSRPARPFN
jgi:hypothetical protein